MNIFLWLIVIIIGVFDARECRIPNYLLVILLIFTVIFLILDAFNENNYVNLVKHIYGFLACFAVGLIFYSLKIVAAGDVKLVAIVGFILGHIAILYWVKYLFLSTFLVGLMYWSLNRLHSSSLGIINRQVKENRNTVYMPFAPVMIIALAMYEYFQH